MEPRIQYAKTSDGLSIAFTVLGSGTEALVSASNTWGDLQLYKAMPLYRAYFDALADRGRRVVIYDPRDMGSSEHRDSDYSDRARLADVEAVVDRVGLGRFNLYGFLHGSHSATAYAVAHPDRVERLVLVNPFASGVDFYTAVPEMAMIARMESASPEEEEIRRLSSASILTGFTDPDLAAQLSSATGSSMSASEIAAFTEATSRSDISSLLPQISVPTLVVFTHSFLPALLPLTREVARLIPGAEFVETGARGAFTPDALTGWLDSIDTFLLASAGPSEPPAGSDASLTGLPSGTAVILFADIVDSTALTEQLGDSAFRDKARGLDTSLRDIIRKAEGTPVEGKLLGDGVLAVFTSARQAIEAALKCGAAGESAGLPLHLGIHAGDVIEEDGNVFGGAVNIAARVAAESAPGEVLVSQTVRELARTSAGVGYEDAGERTLKGVSDAVRVWRVRRG
ncbi:MAG TPA: alpha/beta fold hydrolase [Dehalococcoidia bacterium]